MNRFVYSALGGAILAGGMFFPAMIVSAPAQAQIRIDLGFGQLRWGPQERPYFRRWARQNHWEQRRWEDLRESEREAYWKWRHSHKAKKVHKKHHRHR